MTLKVALQEQQGVSLISHAGSKAVAMLISQNGKGPQVHPPSAIIALTAALCRGCTNWAERPHHARRIDYGRRGNDGNWRTVRAPLPPVVYEYDRPEAAVKMHSKAGILALIW